MTEQVALYRGSVVVDARLGPGAVIADGAVVVRGSRVEEVGPYSQLHERWPDATVTGDGRHAVLPGFVNAHHHGWGLSPLQLGARDDVLERWLVDMIALAPVDLRLDTLLSCLRQIRSGVTAVQHAGIGRDPGAFQSETSSALDAYAASGMRVVYGVQARDRWSLVYADDETFLAGLPEAKAVRMRRALAEVGAADQALAGRVLAAAVERYRDHPTVGLAVCGEGPEWCSDELLRTLRQRSDEHRLPLHLHCLESPAQLDRLRRAYGEDVLAHLDGLGVLGPDVSLAHGVWLSDEDIELCAERGVSICHNPSSNLRLRVGIAEYAALRTAGVKVGIGLDSTALNDDDDYLQELRLALHLHSRPEGIRERPAPTPWDILVHATIEGARAIGLADVGTLEVGRPADLIQVDLKAASRPYTHEALDVAEVIVRRAKPKHVSTVVVAGNVLVSDGLLIHHDERAIGEALAASIREPPPQRLEQWLGAVHEVRPDVHAWHRAAASGQ